MKQKATDSQIIFARKIKELVERGDPGEKEAAERALEKYLQKNDLTMEDIAEVPMQEYGIVSTKENAKFIRQVIASVIGQPSVRGRWKRGRTIYFKSTYAEYVEINDRVNHFLKSYLEEQEIFYSAFIQKNHLYANPDLDDEEEERKPMTPEEKARIWKILQMVGAIETPNYYKKLQ